MARRGFSNTASTLILVGAIDGSSTTSTFNVTVAPSGFPTVPFFVVIDPQTASEEVALVTAVTGSSLTATRGGSLPAPYGSVTRAHSAGALIKHVSTAADFDEANAHVNATSGVHGTTGTFADTSSAQTFTNKTMGSGSVFPATVVDTTSAQTLTNKSLSQAQTHGSADTDAATTSLHHTLGTGALQAAAGSHSHSGTGALQSTYVTAYTANSAITIDGVYRDLSTPNTTVAFMFTVPSSGNVLLQMTTSDSALNSGTFGTVGYFGLRLSGADIAVTQGRAFVALGNGGFVPGVLHFWKLTGLTPGANVTYNVSVSLLGITGSTFSNRTSTSLPMLLEAYAA